MLRSLSPFTRGKACIPGFLRAALHWRYCVPHLCIPSHRRRLWCAEGTQYKDLSTECQQEVLTHAEHSYSSVQGPAMQRRCSRPNRKCVLKAGPAGTQRSGLSHSGSRKAGAIYTNAEKSRSSAAQEWWRWCLLDNTFDHHILPHRWCDWHAFSTFLDYN